MRKNADLNAHKGIIPPFRDKLKPTSLEKGVFIQQGHQNCIDTDRFTLSSCSTANKCNILAKSATKTSFDIVLPSATGSAILVCVNFSLIEVHLLMKQFAWIY